MRNVSLLSCAAAFITRLRRRRRLLPTQTGGSRRYIVWRKMIVTRTGSGSCVEIPRVLYRKEYKFIGCQYYGVNEWFRRRIRKMMWEGERVHFILLF